MGSTPLREGPFKLVMATVAIAAVPMGATAIATLFPELGWRVLVVGLCTAALSVIVVRHALRRAECGSLAAGICFGFSVIAAVLNAPLSFVATGLSMGEPEAVVVLPVGVLFATFFGAVITVPLGLLFGALFSTLVGGVHHLVHSEAIEAEDLTVRNSGLWLSAMGAACFLVLHTGVSAEFMGRSVFNVLELIVLGMTVIGATVGSLAHLRLGARRFWLLRVRAGLEPGWEIRPVADLDASRLSGLSLLTHSSSDEWFEVLVRHRPDTGAGVYRKGAHFEPIALL